jgi:cysteinyl-tRNA synthetase
MTKHQLRDMTLDLAPNKRSPSDLLLWNTTDDIECRYSDRILGSGFPSAHLQDLAILLTLFRGKYQLHGGGVDLIYPHHESILSELNILTSLKRPVEFWTHVGPLFNRGKKMSNSLNNAIQLRKTLQCYGPNIIRLYMYSEHYRKPVDFSESRLQRLEKLNEKISRIVSNTRLAGSSMKSSGKKEHASLKRFLNYIEDDFDTVILSEMAENGNASASLLEILEVLGLQY